MGKGRWTQAATAERREKVLRFMVEFMSLRDEALRQMAQHVGADVRTVRSDLDALLVGNRPGHVPVPQELAREFERIASLDDLQRFEKRVAVERLAGRLTLADARYLGAICRSLERVLEARAPKLSDGEILARAFAECPSLPE